MEMKSILFVCVQNSCRSQMAEGFARFFADDKVAVFSAGSNPSGIVDPVAVKVMSEEGIDINAQLSKGFKDLPINKFDYVVTLGCGDVCPFIPAHRHISWEIQDPKGKGIQFFRDARDVIKNKVYELLVELGAI